MTRAGGSLPGDVRSASASLSRGVHTGEIELARSNSVSGPGNARLARLTAASSLFSYDLGHQHADTAFSGTQRGAGHNYLTASTQYFKPVTFVLNASQHKTDLSRSTGVPYIEALDAATLAATLHDRYTLELGAIEKGTTVSGLDQNGHQRGARVRGDQEMVFGLLSVEAEVGRARELGASRTYTDLSVGVRRPIPRGYMALWGDRYSGGSVTKGAEGTVTVGGDASLRITGTTDVTLMGYGTRQSTPGAGWNSQLDVLVSHRLTNGNSISLRARVIGGGQLSSQDRSVAYLEYGLPLRLPVSRLRTTGRVYGRVVDAETGNGVAGALVRLGPQVAITDKHGEVAFGGVPGGQHRVSMSQETSFADAVFMGDPTLVVDSTRTVPTTFTLAIARSAHLDIKVRRFAVARTGIAGGPDSLVDAGAVSNATLLLAGERDTLYRTTGDAGEVAFTDIPPGKWTVTVRGDAPAFHRFDPDRIEITLSAAEGKEIAFRLVPRRREVQLIGDGQELRSTTDVKAQAPAPAATKTIKPNDKRQK